MFMFVYILNYSVYLKKGQHIEKKQHVFLSPQVVWLFNVVGEDYTIVILALINKIMRGCTFFCSDSTLSWNTVTSSHTIHSSGFTIVTVILYIHRMKPVFALSLEFRIGLISTLSLDSQI